MSQNYHLTVNQGIMLSSTETGTDKYNTESIPDSTLRLPFQNTAEGNGCLLGNNI